MMAIAALAIFMNYIVLQRYLVQIVEFFVVNLLDCLLKLLIRWKWNRKDRMIQLMMMRLFFILEAVSTHIEIKAKHAFVPIVAKVFILAYRAGDILMNSGGAEIKF